MERSDLTIRKATRKDVEAVTRFCILGAKGTTNKDLNEEDVKAGISFVVREHPDFFLVAKKGNEYVGQLKVHVHYYDWYDATFWWIEHVYVDENYRRQGIARFMLDFVVELAKEHGYVKGLLLLVSKSNKAASRLYNEFGFEPSMLQLMNLELQRNA